jgi:hypothetical protein
MATILTIGLQPRLPPVNKSAEKNKYLKLTDPLCHFHRQASHRETVGPQSGPKWRNLLKRFLRFASVEMTRTSALIIRMLKNTRSLLAGGWSRISPVGGIIAVIGENSSDE